MLQKQYSVAVKQYRKAIDLAVGSVKVKAESFLALAYFEAEKYSQALDCIKEVRRVDPESLDYQWDLGLILQRLARQKMLSVRSII